MPKPFLYVSRTQVEDLLAKAKSSNPDSVPTIEDIEKQVEFKPWYRQLDYRSAEIDFGDRAPGVVLVLQDAQAKHTKTIRDLITFKDDAIEIPSAAIGAMLRAHVLRVEERGEGKAGDIFCADLPKPNAELANWTALIDNMLEKNVRRLREGIWHFRSKEINEGND